MSTHLLDLTPDALRECLAQCLGEPLPEYRVSQLLEWMFEHHVDNFAAMTSLPQHHREIFARGLHVCASRIVADQRSADGTRKLLLNWINGGTSECVWIPAGQRHTACISTQVGCPVQCSFCASGIGGLERNLTAGEIVEQALRIAKMCAEHGARLGNVVVMGSGEPLANYGPVVQALRAINADWGLRIGARRITISTVGLPSQIRRLAEEDLQITLALSLHAPNDALRRRLIPWAQQVGMSALVDACGYYFARTGREVTVEYILLDGVNNLPEHASQLAAICRRLRSNVNLIPYNPVGDLEFKRPSDRAVRRFAQQLQAASVNVHVRQSRGLDIDAACGQLRRRVAAGR